MKLDTLSYIDSVRSKNQRPLDVIGRILAEIDHFELVLKEKLVTILRTSIFGLFSYQSEQPEGLSSNKWFIKDNVWNSCHWSDDSCC